MRAKIIGFLVLAFGGVGITPAGKELFRAIFWDRMVHFMSPIFAIPLSILLEYGLPALLVGTGFWLLVGPDRRHSILNWARDKLNLFLVTSAIFAVASLMAAAGYFWDRSRGPIIWIWDSNSPIGGSMSGNDRLLWVDGFQIKGRNRSTVPISPTMAYVRSDTNARQIELFFSIGPGRGPVSVDRATIPPDSQFSLHGFIPAADPNRSNGISAQQFREQFREFTFVFEYQGGAPYIERFSASEVDGILTKAERANREALDNAIFNSRGPVITHPDRN